MTFPDEIFPEDKIDPTVSKDVKMSVEETLGVMGHVKAMTRKRKKNWRFLVQEDVSANDLDGAANKIREFYELPKSAPVAHQGNVWAVWAGEGGPTAAAFESEPEPLAVAYAGPAVEFEADQTLLAEVLKNAPPGTIVGEGDHAKTVAMLEAKRLRETWAYSTKDIADQASMRERFQVRYDAPIELDPNGGDVAAIWLGKGAPTRPAFPDVAQLKSDVTKPNGVVPPGAFSSGGARDGSLCSVCGEPAGSVLRHGHSCTGTSHTSHASEVAPDDLPKPVRVSPFVPSAALNDMGLKLYGMSKEPVFNETFRKFLLQVSDSLHAEAARIELTKVRKSFDGRKP